MLSGWVQFAYLLNAVRAAYEEVRMEDHAEYGLGRLLGVLRAVRIALLRSIAYDQVESGCVSAQLAGCALAAQAMGRSHFG